MATQQLSNGWQLTLKAAPIVLTALIAAQFQAIRTLDRVVIRQEAIQKELIEMKVLAKELKLRVDILEKGKR